MNNSLSCSSLNWARTKDVELEIKFKSEVKPVFCKHCTDLNGWILTANHYTPFRQFSTETQYWLDLANAYNQIQQAS